MLGEKYVRKLDYLVSQIMKLELTKHFKSYLLVVLQTSLTKKSNFLIWSFQHPVDLLETQKNLFILGFYHCNGHRLALLFESSLYIARFILCIQL